MAPAIPAGPLTTEQRLEVAIEHLKQYKMLGEGSRRRRGTGRSRKKKSKKKGDKGGRKAVADKPQAPAANDHATEVDAPPPCVPVMPGMGGLGDMVGASAHPLSTPHNAASSVANPNPASHPAYSGGQLFPGGSRKSPSGGRISRINATLFPFASPPMKPSTKFSAPTPAAAPKSISTPGITASWPFSSPAFTPSALFSNGFTPGMALTPVSLQQHTPKLTPSTLLMTEPLGSPTDASMLESPSVLIDQVSSARSSMANVSAAQDLLGFAHANTPEPATAKDMVKAGAGKDGDAALQNARVARTLSFPGNRARASASDGADAGSPPMSDALRAATGGLHHDDDGADLFPGSPKAMAALALHQLATPTQDGFASPHVPNSLAEFEDVSPMALTSPSPGYPSPNILRKRGRRAAGSSRARGALALGTASPGRPMIRIKRSALASRSGAASSRASKRQRCLA